MKFGDPEASLEKVRDDIASGKGLDFPELRRILHSLPSLEKLTIKMTWEDWIHRATGSETVRQDVGWIGGIMKQELAEWHARGILEVSGGCMY